MISVENLTVRYGETVAVEDVSFELERGEFVGLVGESGAGKSTLGSALVGLGGDTAGSIQIDDTELVSANDATIRNIRRSTVGLIFQNAGDALHPAYTIGEQIAEGIDGRRRGWRRRHEPRIQELLDDVGLSFDHAERYPHELSGGQKQRSLIAVGLTGDPDFLVADEPTSSLDTVTQAAVLETLERLGRERGLGVLYITHDLNIVHRCCDRMLVMRNAELIECGDIDQVIPSPNHQYTAKLLAARQSDLAAVDGGTAASMHETQSGAVGHDNIDDTHQILRNHAVDDDSDPATIDTRRNSRESEKPVVSLDSVIKTFVDDSLLPSVFGKATETDAVVDVSLSIGERESLALVGRSGAGKTTIARIIAGLEQPTDGTVQVNGKSVGDVRDRPQYLREAIGYVFQSPGASLDPRRTVEASVAEPLRAAGWKRVRRRERVAELLAAVSLDGYENRYPNQLSGGEAQRVAVARALALDPDLLILDEATSALDAVTTDRLCRLFERLGRDRATLLVTHDLSIAARLADRTAVLHNGQIVERGKTDALFTESTHDETHALVDASFTNYNHHD